MIPALVPAEPTTALPLPHSTWHEEWRPIIERFAAAVASMPHPERVAYADFPLGTRLRVMASKLLHGKRPKRPSNQFRWTWYLPQDAIADAGLEYEMWRLAEALWRYELPPGGGTILTDMLVVPGRHLLWMFAWLRGAIADLAGSQDASLAPPVVHSLEVADGNVDGSFEMHSDMWMPAMLCNVFNEVVPLQGEPLLLRMEDMWPVAAEAGVPSDVLDGMRRAIVGAGTMDYYERFNDGLYAGHPWTSAVAQALWEAAWRFEAKPGDGYFLNDREWMHSRTLISSLAPVNDHRLYRLVYNNARLEAAITPRRELETPVPI